MPSEIRLDSGNTRGSTTKKKRTPGPRTPRVLGSLVTPRNLDDDLGGSGWQMNLTKPQPIPTHCDHGLVLLPLDFRRRKTDISANDCGSAPVFGPDSGIGNSVQDSAGMHFHRTKTDVTKSYDSGPKGQGSGREEGYFGKKLTDLTRQFISHY